MFKLETPSYIISPLSGSCNPNKHFNSTVFPDPLCPIIKFVLPFSKVVEILWIIVLPSKDFFMFLISIISLIIIV